MARHYFFQSDWKISAPRDKVWQSLTATPFLWAKWWPELTKLTTLEISDSLVGTRFSCVWRARSGYKLHCSFTVTSADNPNEISFSCQGDLRGSARWTFTAHDHTTHIHIDWQAETHKWWMNVFGPLLTPVFIHNHDVIMASGERGLNHHLMP